ncbi:unnamed protein product [Acanthoscelides obtectus]|nr:unnamed protein product [Acanthoscelides obtectus]CAK1627435.1 hypothetical protein AOBTE_LOCUS4598 [Acanthoscelides obtectus]
MKKYPPPENAHNFGAPKLNAVVKQAIVDSVAKRDSRLSCQQAQVGSGLSAIAIVISDLLKTEGGNAELIEKLSDAGRLLSDVHHTLSVSRKELAILNLNKEWKETLIDSPVDEWLFGEDLEERLKAAKSLQFSSKQLKTVKAPQPKKYFKLQKSIQLSTGSQTRWTISPRSQQSESQQSGFQQAVQLSVQSPGGISSTGPIQECEEIPQVLENSTSAIGTHFPDGRSIIREALKLGKVPTDSLEICMASISESTLKQYSRV